MVGHVGAAFGGITPIVRAEVIVHAGIGDRGVGAFPVFLAAIGGASVVVATVFLGPASAFTGATYRILCACISVVAGTFIDGGRHASGRAIAGIGCAGIVVIAVGRLEPSLTGTVDAE